MVQPYYNGDQREMRNDFDEMASHQRPKKILD